MSTTCRALLVVALIGGWVRGTAAGEAPKLQYGFEGGKYYGYDVTIKVDTDDYTTTYTGHTMFRGISAQDDRFTLEAQGSLSPHTKRKRANDLTDYGIMGLLSMAPHVVIDRSGKPQGSMGGLKPLPYVLGFLETLPLERLPSEPQDKWQFEEELEIAEGRFGIHMMFPSRKATEETEYTITGVQGDLVRIGKKYLMRTGEVAPGAASVPSRVRMEGSGSVVFDRRAGVVSSINTNYTLLLKTEDESRTVTAAVDCRLMNPDRLQQLLTELENNRKQATGEAYAGLPKKPLEPAERAKLLRDLRSQDPKVQEAAIVRLISAERDDRPADFAVPLATILQQTGSLRDDVERMAAQRDRRPKSAGRDRRLNAVGRDLKLRAAQRHLRPKAAQALIVWATPEAEEALVEATGDHTIMGVGSPGAGFAVADAAYEALATIGTESAARGIARQIIDPSGKPAEVLKRMGPPAEVPMIELLDDLGEIAEARAACEVLAEIGSIRSVLALKRASEDWRTRTQAAAALEAIAKREGLTVDELLAKAQAAAPAPVAGPTATSASSGLRTWTDSTGQFKIEAEMVSVENGVVTLKRRDGKTVEVPLDRLSQADRDFVQASKAGGPGPKPESSVSSIPQASARPKGAPYDTELVGGPGGMEFRFVDREQRPLLGLWCRIAHWEGKPAVGLNQALFNASPMTMPGAIMAKPGYAVGGMRVEAQTYVNALQLIFMRQKPDGTLDPSDQYESPWIGTRSARPAKTLGATGATVIGVHGRRAAVLDAVGLVMQ